MAGASMKDIKLRIKSVESTMQITKAMELVASSKLRKAKERQERSRPYFIGLKETLVDIESSTKDFSSPYQKQRDIKKRCLIMIAGDRGLAGGYNSNIIKAVIEKMQGDIPTCILPIGKRAVDFCNRKGIEIVTSEFIEAGSISIPDCFAISNLVTQGYLSGQFDEVSIIYTQFVSMLTQTPRAESLLPLKAESNSERKESHSLVLYEPSPEEVYDAIVPGYIAGMIYGAMCESVASEQGARRTAMDAASKNAAEMIEDLSLRYNRARQGAITQEITEIVAGAEH
ncbi:MAG: ATP synthase F1 subunit gamma [Clostridia bacterium]|nr:ATP synthase F1 subunit gamma [Clostridia bacterium]MBQ7053304.1 ATP synthase F1 subunit gamma [Clostridia bacterium]